MLNGWSEKVEKKGGGRDDKASERVGFSQTRSFYHVPRGSYRLCSTLQRSEREEEEEELEEEQTENTFLLLDRFRHTHPGSSDREESCVFVCFSLYVLELL